jgi:FHA domain
MVAPAPAGSIDLSRQVLRLEIVRLMDYALVYGGFRAIVSVVAPIGSNAGLHPDLLWLAAGVCAICLAACCLVVGLKNIGSITSRNWNLYIALLWLLMLVLPPATFLLANKGFIGWALCCAGGLVWCGVTLSALFRLRSSAIAGMSLNLEQLAATMADGGSDAAAPDTFGQVKPVNRAKGLAFGLAGTAVLIGSVWLSRQSLDAFYIHVLVDFAGCFLLVRMRRYFQIDAKALLRVDSRPPILFLRSFEDEEKLNFIQSGRALFDYSLETRLSRHFIHFGPFIALGSPQEELPQLGAARISLPQDKWQIRVRQWMGSSQVVLMYAGNTYWVNWELALLARKDRLHKVILLIPPRRGSTLRSDKVIADIRVRLTCVKGALQDTRWAAAAAALKAEKNLRALIFHPDGGVTVIRSRWENREAYHLAVLVSHHLMRRQEHVPVLCLKSSPTPALWPILGSVMRIGAARQNDVALAEDAFVSAQHARIERIGSELAIVDLDSRNGTFINGTVLRGAKRKIEPGDEIGVGQSTFVVQAG